MSMETVFDLALAYVEAREPNSQSGLMVLYLIVERWLDHVEYAFSLYSPLFIVLLTDVHIHHAVPKRLDPLSTA